MKAWQVTHWGEPEQMTLADVPVPEPGPGQVRIRNHAAGLNFFDILQIQGKYQMKPAFPFTPGAEVAGTIDAAGSGVSGFEGEQRVMAFPENGGFAEYTLARADHTFPIPDALGNAQAATLLVYHTSLFALKLRAALRPGEWLLVHAGASGVGMSAIQIGKALGARVIATASSQEKLDFCGAQGADFALSYAHPGWVDGVKEITGGRGADVIYDPVGGDAFDLSTKCIAPEGRLLIIGFASGRIPTVAANRILLKNIAIVGAVWGGYAFRTPGYLAETHADLMARYAAGAIRPAISRSLPLEDAPAGLRALADRQVAGKAVLVVGP